MARLFVEVPWFSMTRVQATIATSPEASAHVCASSAAARDTKTGPATTKSAAIPTTSTEKRMAPSRFRERRVDGTCRRFGEEDSPVLEVGGNGVAEDAPNNTVLKRVSRWRRPSDDHPGHDCRIPQLDLNAVDFCAHSAWRDGFVAVVRSQSTPQPSARLGRESVVAFVEAWGEVAATEVERESSSKTRGHRGERRGVTEHNGRSIS